MNQLIPNKFIVLSKLQKDMMVECLRPLDQVSFCYYIPTMSAKLSPHSQYVQALAAVLKSVKDCLKIQHMSITVEE